MAWDTEQASEKLRCPEPRRGRAPGRVWTTLLKRADFLRLAAGARRVTPGFILQVAPAGEPSSVLRVGFTASRKVGNAVARNRVKRRLRALADRVMLDAANPANDYVFIGRGETLSRDFAAMEQDLRQALRKIAAKGAS
jgi:ribonuclease P protein component